MNELFNFLNEITPISVKTWDSLSSIINIENYPKKTNLCKIGEFPESVYFLKEGYARKYLITHDEKEYNSELLGPSEMMIAFSALMQKTRLKIGIECLTDCEVYQANFKDYMELTKLHPELKELYKKAIEISYIKLEQNTIRLSTMNATQRYLKLRELIPNVDTNIRQYHIASHIGVTPIQLSRIRKELFVV